MNPRLLLPVAAAFLCVSLAAKEPDTTPGSTTLGAPPPGENIVVMEPYRVRGNAVSSFSIGVQIFINKASGTMKLFVTSVSPGSDAERLGLRVGDEILKIGGYEVSDLEPDVGKDSVIGQLLLNRKTGETLELEYISQQPRAVKLRATNINSASNPRPDSEVEAPARKSRGN